MSYVKLKIFQDLSALCESPAKKDLEDRLFEVMK